MHLWIGDIRMVKSTKFKNDPLSQIMHWAHAKSLVALPFIGTVCHHRLAQWLDWNMASQLGPAPGSASPRQADLLVVIGHISQKLAPILQRLHGRMASPSFVLCLGQVEGDLPHADSYASVADISQVIPVDVIIRGVPPSQDDINAGLEILTARIREQQSQPLIGK